ncbi:PREDICTED: organic cation transporter 1-like [Papilio xuthus]|uniref:Organic cation transporter 1-like n=1 Tax=Papilio xuthus TaxID=66420 RepID=A0AAJ6ZM82_PAPXU|nr:PREDICTED: organic cation transporter 1-like [Papilio xuthus]
MTSWTKELDEAAVLATSKGTWHIFLFYLLCSLAAIPTSFLVFSQVFTNATPEHWCSPPRVLQNLSLPDRLLKELTVPKHNGVYEWCSSYTFDEITLFEMLNDYVDERSEIINKDGDHQMIKTKYLMQAVGIEEREKQIARVIEAVTLIRNMSTKCTTGWQFTTEEYPRTLVTEYSLVCENEWLARISYTLFWVGSIFGNLLFGWMSDRYGRRPTILLMICLEVPLAIATAFPNSYTTYIALRIIGGLFFPALYQQPFILALELMPPSRRPNVGIVVGMFFAGGISLLAVIAYAVRDWFHLTLATSVPFIMCFGYYWLIPESPRWLVGKGRIIEADEVLRKLAKKNGINLAEGFLLNIHRNLVNEDFEEERANVIPTNINKVEITESVDNKNVNCRINNMLIFKPDVKILSRNNSNAAEESIDLLDELQSLNSQPKTKTENTSKKITRIFIKNGTDDEDSEIMDDISNENYEASLLDIFRYPNIRKKFLLSTFDWLSLGVIYNSLSYNTSNLGVNDHLAFFIGGVVEIPSYIVGWHCMERYGRRWVLCIFMSIGGLACLSCTLVPEDMPWVTVALALSGRLFVAAAFAVFYVMIGELLPTVLRAQAIGLASFITGLGLLACPYIVHLAVYGRTLPLFLMGLLSIIAGVIPLFLPETLNQPLPQTLKDGETFGRNTKIFSCAKITT